MEWYEEYLAAACNTEALAEQLMYGLYANVQTFLFFSKTTSTRPTIFSLIALLTNAFFYVNEDPNIPNYPPYSTSLPNLHTLSQRLRGHHTPPPTNIKSLLMSSTVAYPLRKARASSRLPMRRQHLRELRFRPDCWAVPIEDIHWNGDAQVINSQNSETSS